MLKRLVGIMVVVALLVPASVSAHAATSITGTVDCKGNYSITPRGDIWGGVHLIVTLNGKIIVDEAQLGNDRSARDFGPYTGTGAYEDEVISAYTSDNPNAVYGTLVISRNYCDKPAKPDLRFTGPCGDPMHGVLFLNYTDRSLWGHFGWRSATSHIWHNTWVLVKAHTAVRTGWKHVLGYSMMGASLGGVIKHQRAAAPGTYKTCR